MKLNKLIYSVRESLKDYSDDSELTDRFITFLLDTKRAKLVAQKINSYATKLPAAAIQALCIDIEEVNRYKCGIDIMCDNLKRSSVPLPKFFDTVTGSSIITVNSLDIIGRPFKFVDINLVPYIGYSTYNDKIFTFLDDDNYLYVYSTSDSYKFIECVEVRGIYETPLDLEDFNNCCGCEEGTDTKCFTGDTEYPVPGEMVRYNKNNGS